MESDISELDEAIEMPVSQQVPCAKPDNRDPTPISGWMAGIWFVMAREEYQPVNRLKMERKRAK